MTEKYAKAEAGFAADCMARQKAGAGFTLPATQGGGDKWDVEWPMDKQFLCSASCAGRHHMTEKQREYANRIRRQCLAEAGDDVEAGLAAADYILSLQLYEDEWVTVSDSFLSVPLAVEQHRLPEIVVNVPQQAPPKVQVNIPAQAAPIVNVTVPKQDFSPTIHLDVPEQRPPDITVNVPKQEVVVNIPEQKPPDITVNVPRQEPPTVNVSLPTVNVAAPQVTVEVPAPKDRKVVFDRDSQGRIVGGKVEEM